MSMDLGKWLACLPIGEEESAEGIIITGERISSSPGQIRVVVGELRLTFRRDDVLQLDAAGELTEPYPVRIVLRHGALLQDAVPSDLCKMVSPGKRPFTLACRPAIVTHKSSRHFQALEERFLKDHALLDR